MTTNKRIDQLDDAAALDGSEYVPVIQGAPPAVRTTTQDIADLGGGGGGGVGFAQETAATPLGDPGWFAIGAGTETDGGWMDFRLQNGASKESTLTLGGGADDSYQSFISGSTVGAAVGTYSDGSDTGYTQLETTGSTSRVRARSEVGQNTNPTLSILDEEGDPIFEVINSGLGGGWGGTGRFTAGATVSGSEVFRFAHATDGGYIAIGMNNPALQIVLSATQSSAPLRITHPTGPTILWQITADGSMEMHEISSPGNGPADVARIYAHDNGSGKTEVRVVFHTGASVLLAIEP